MAFFLWSKNNEKTASSKNKNRQKRKNLKSSLLRRLRFKIYLMRPTLSYGTNPKALISIFQKIYRIEGKGLTTTICKVMIKIKHIKISHLILKLLWIFRTLRLRLMVVKILLSICKYSLQWLQQLTTIFIKSRNSFFHLSPRPASHHFKT